MATNTVANDVDREEEERVKQEWRAANERIKAAQQSALESLKQAQIDAEALVKQAQSAALKHVAAAICEAADSDCVYVEQHNKMVVTMARDIAVGKALNFDLAHMIIDRPPSYLVPNTPQIKAAREQETARAEREAADKEARRVAAAYINAGLVNDLEDVTFKSIMERGLPDNDSIRSLFAAMQGYSRNIAATLRTLRTIVIVGNTGTLKTTVAAAFVHEIVRCSLVSGVGGGKAKLVNANDIYLHLQSLQGGDAWNSGHYAEQNSYLRELTATTILVLDDLGQEPDLEWLNRTMINSILLPRYQRGKLTIITSNVTKNGALEKRYSVRLWDRLTETGTSHVFHTSGVSLRQLPPTIADKKKPASKAGKKKPASK